MDWVITFAVCFAVFFAIGIKVFWQKMQTNSNLTKGRKRLDKETIGTVLSVTKQWWVKVNTKPIRMGSLDGATFLHIIKVQYVVGGNIYTKRKWIGSGKEIPAVGSELTVLYCSNNPSKAKIL